MISQEKEQNCIFVPLKPIIQPIRCNEMLLDDEFMLESSFNPAVPHHHFDFQLLNLFQIQTKEEIPEVDQNHFTFEEIDQMTARRPIRQLKDTFQNNSRQHSMLFKLEKLDKIPSKRRHY